MYVRRKKYLPLGGVEAAVGKVGAAASTLKSVAPDLVDYSDLLVKLVKDPHLKSVACSMRKLYWIDEDIKSGKYTGFRPNCDASVVVKNNNPSVLKHVSGPLRAYTWLRGIPAIGVAAPAIVIGLPLLLIFALGRISKK